MKLIHVITSLSDGGAEAVLYHLCKHDHTNRHHVVSLSGLGKYGPKLKELGVTVTSLNISMVRQSPLAFIRLVKLVIREKPDAVQTWMYHADLFGGLAVRIAGLKSVFWGIHNTTLETGNSKSTSIWIAKMLAKLSWWMPTKIVVCAQRAIDVHEAFGYDRRKMCFIPNGYDLADFKPTSDSHSEFRVSLNSNLLAPLIGMVARFHPQKDHSNLLDALSILRARGIKFHCVLVGTEMNSFNKEIINWIDQRGLGDYIYLLGQRDDIPVIMNAIDLHLLSSSSEAFPNVVCEAMACGTPCVVTDVGDAAYIVGDTGWVVPPSDPAALAAAIEAAIKELKGPNWQNRTQSARNRIQENFSIERMVNEYNRLWKASLEL
jgi:glycosyltransferase involved in cell wall biosynthesis